MNTSLLQVTAAALAPSWRGAVTLTALSALLLSGCAGRRLAEPAPVVDRSASTSTGTNAAPASVEVKPMPGAENAGRPGYYTVQPGDTLFRIALDAGQNWRDIQAWNSLTNPNVIEAGQVLRVAPPVGSAASSAFPASGTGATVAPVAPAAVVSRPLSVTGSSTVTAALPSFTATTATAPAPVAASPAVPAADALNFIWPAQGAVTTAFDEAKNKGVAIGGKVGDPVLAAADGRVVYAGAGLRGYGNLIILKHNNTFLTAYAHNQALLVKEDQTVKQGQRIAEMGSSDADRVKLHFEVRRNGKPVDPLSYLPKR